ncbi:MAG: hypothetical protein KKD28_04030 [Chloroflexi bacterium]|nr:hypothetical protein [Chloroflexota bacterium]
MSEQRKASVYLSLGFLIVISLVIGLSIFMRTSEWKVDLISFTFPWGGGGGLYLYDKDGNPHSTPGTMIYVEDYSGPAPLYEVQQYSKWPAKAEIISPTLAIQGKPYYPVILTVSFGSDNWARVGESQVFTANVEVVDFYPSEMSLDDFAMMYIREMTTTDVFTITFNLNSPNFEISSIEPSKQFGVNIPASYRWIISPKPYALGKQHFQINLDYGVLPSLNGIVEYEVRPTIGIKPILYTVLGILGSIGLGLFGIAKAFPNLWMDYQKAFGKNKSAKKKRNKKRKKKAG